MCKAMEELYNVGRKEGVDIGRKEGANIGRKERNEEIAKAMLADGESVEKIMRYTPLTRVEIEKMRIELQ